MLLASFFFYLTFPKGLELFIKLVQAVAFLLDFTTTWASSADEKLMIAFSFFQKVGFEISYKSSSRDNLYECQSLLSEKKSLFSNKTNFQSVACWNLYTACWAIILHPALIGFRGMVLCSVPMRVYVVTSFIKVHCFFSNCMLDTKLKIKLKKKIILTFVTEIAVHANKTEVFPLPTTYMFLVKKISS